MMVLFEEEILISRSSVSILFFKKELEHGDDIWKWKQYYKLNIRGFVTLTRGNKRIQVTDETHIYFYSFDENYQPVLEGVMRNYLKAMYLAIDPQLKYAVSYKTNEQDFEINQKKYHHSFCV